VKEALRDRLQRSLAQRSDMSSAVNLVREYLQASVLDKLQSMGAMVPLCLHGGTMTETTWHAAVRRRLADIDWALLRRDVEKLLEPGERAEWMTSETLVRLLSSNEPTAG